MPNSDFSDFSDSDSDGGPPVSLECGECKKKFKSTDRGCDTDERTCSTCTKKAHKALMNAFMVDPAQKMPSEAAAAPTTNIDDAEESVDKGDTSGDANKGGVDERVNDAMGEISGQVEEAAPPTTMEGENSTPNTLADGPYVTPRKQDDEDGSDADLRERGDSDDEESNGSNTPKTKSKKSAKKGSNKRVSDYDSDVDDLLLDEASIEVI